VLYAENGGEFGEDLWSTDPVHDDDVGTSQEFGTSQ
jgi:hypothetical protein